MATTAKKSAKEAKTVKTIEDLQAEIVTKRQDLVEAKRALSAGELANTNAISDIKKSIARLMSQINQKKGKV